MGTIARTVQRLERLIPSPERKTSVGAQIPTWEAGVPQTRRQSYERYALDGFSQNEIVFACCEELATSAAEPRLVAVRKKAGGEPEQLKDHPVLELFEHPNPFMSRYQLIANLIMFRTVAGNAYLEMGRSGAHKVVELWPLRSDRMFVIPDEREHIRGWEYRLGAQSWTLPAEDVIHSRTRNPADDYYGLPPLAVCAQRVDTDALMRSFTLAFFHNAAVPAGLLNIKKPVTQAERAFIQQQVRGEAGGPSGWHQLLVLDATEAAYTQMGLPLGQGGIVLPELDEISEARIAMCCVPGTEVMTRRGLVSIEAVRVGDEVVTHRGRWRPVTQVMCNPAHGRPMVRVKAKGLDALQVTADHPVYAAQFTQTRGHQGVLERFAWMNAGDLRSARRNKRGPFDALTVPMLAETAVDTVHVAEHIPATRVALHEDGGRLVSAMPNATAIAAHVALSPALGRLLGYYLAEGSTSRDRVLWYCAKEEIDYQDRVIDDLRLCFGINASRVQRGSVTVVIAHSALLARFFGRGTARTKVIPSWAWDGDEHFRAAVLGAWLDGDGCRDGAKMRGFTASKSLAWGILLFALSLGYAPAIGVDDQNARPNRSIRGQSVGGSRGYVVRWLSARERPGSYQVHAHHLTSRVRATQTLDYDGPVYNLEVEGDHSYLTTGGMVHNCMGVPLELIGARLGMVHGNRSTTLAARGTFWDETLVPLYAELGADFTRGLYPEYAGTPDEFDYLEFDLSTVKALAEDDDAKHKRVREDVAAGLLSIQEARVALGHDATFEKDALLMLARGMEPMLATEALKGGPPAQATGDGRQATDQSDPNAERQAPNGNGNGNGKKPPSKEQLAALAQLAAGKD